MKENRKVLFSMINKQNSSYVLYDKNNNLIFEFTNNDILYNDSDITWKIENRSNKFFIVKYSNYGIELLSRILPTRINILWAMDQNTMKINPYKYIKTYDNILEKFLVYRNISKYIIKYNFNDKSGKKYVIEFDEYNIPVNINIFTSDQKIYKVIVNELDNLM